MTGVEIFGASFLKEALAWAAQLENALLDEQDRQLNRFFVSRKLHVNDPLREEDNFGTMTHGLPSLPKTTPSGSGFGASVVTGAGASPPGLLSRSVSVMIKLLGFGLSCGNKRENTMK